MRILANAKSAEDVLAAFSCVRGPWAMIFWQVGWTLCLLEDWLITLSTLSNCSLQSLHVRSRRIMIICFTRSFSFLCLCFQSTSPEVAASAHLKCFCWHLWWSLFCTIVGCVTAGCYSSVVVWSWLHWSKISPVAIASIIWTAISFVLRG